MIKRGLFQHRSGGYWTAISVVIAAFFAMACAPIFSTRDDEITGRVVVKTTPPITLAIEEKGRGEPILLLHGLGTSGYTWRHLIPELAKTNRVIALDLKGFGASDKPGGGKYSVFDQAEIVKAYIEQADLRNVTLVGHSFGGGIALAVTLQMMDAKSKRIKRLALLDTIAYKQPLPVFFKILTTPGVGQVSLAVIPPEMQITEALHIAYWDQKKNPS